MTVIYQTNKESIMYNYQNKTTINPELVNRNPNISIALPAAAFGGALLISFFLLMSLLGYETMTGLRFLNFILLIPIIVNAIKNYVNTVHGKSYLEAFRVSVLSFAGSYVILAVFMFVYLMVIDPALMVYLNEHAVPNIKLNAFGVTALLLGEGLIGGVLLSYVTLQHYKDRLKRMV